MRVLSQAYFQSNITSYLKFMKQKMITLSLSPYNTEHLSQNFINKKCPFQTVDTIALKCTFQQNMTYQDGVANVDHKYAHIY